MNNTYTFVKVRDFNNVNDYRNFRVSCAKKNIWVCTIWDDDDTLPRKNALVTNISISDLKYSSRYFIYGSDAIIFKRGDQYQVLKNRLLNENDLMMQYFLFQVSKIKLILI